jgi:hypothetical protein
MVVPTKVVPERKGSPGKWLAPKRQFQAQSAKKKLRPLLAGAFELPQALPPETRNPKRT